MIIRNSIFYSTIIIFLSILGFSCGNGFSSTDENRGNALDVNLVICIDGEKEKGRVLAVDEEWGSLLFKYTATPLWTSSDNNVIQGTVPDMTEFVNGSPLPLKVLPGPWEFAVEIYDGEVLIYSGTSGVAYISSGNNSVQVAVSGLNTGDPSGVSVEIKVPVVRASVTDTLSVSWSGTAWGSTEISPGTDDGAGCIVFRKRIENLIPGGYTFVCSLNHSDGNYSILSGETSHLNIREGSTASVCGILEGYSTSLRPVARVTFVDNRAHYATGGESWSNVSLPQARNVFSGDSLSLSGVPVATATYTLSGISYNISCAGTQWYTDSACTKPWDMSSPVQEDMTLYASWHCSSKTVEQTAAGTALTFTVPKFITSISGYCIGGGGASEYAGKDVDDDYCEVAIYGEGGWGSAASFGPTPINGGSTVTLYTGAPASASYININGSRKITGAAGSSGGSITPRYNIYDYDSSMEKTIVASSITRKPAVLLQCAVNGSTLLVSGKSIRCSVRFQFYRSSGNSSSGTIKLRISTNGGSSWNAYDEQIGTYKETDENNGTYFREYSFSRSSFTQKSVHAYTPSTYGQPGSGGFSVSRGTSYKLGQQAGFRGRSYVTLK